MKVFNVMTKNPFTVTEDTPVADAQSLMKREKIHRLPVLNHQHKLVGIVSEKDLLYASPSPATTLNIYEMSNLLAKLKVKSVMTKKVITIHQSTLIEDAARILVDNNIGGLPVMEEDRLIGIVTESDLFKLLIELFGTRKRGIRAAILLPEKRGELADIAGAISEKGGNIISIGTFPGNDPTNALCTIKVDEISKEDFVEAITPYVIELLDIREI